LAEASHRTLDLLAPIGLWNDRWIVGALGKIIGGTELDLLVGIIVCALSEVRQPVYAVQMCGRGVGLALAEQKSLHGPRQVANAFSEEVHRCVLIQLEDLAVFVERLVIEGDHA
jgi:hypothetical protein